MYKKKDVDCLGDFISKVWSSHLDEIKPVLRLATPHLKKMSRFDCLFFIVDWNCQKINLGSSDNLEEL